MSFFLFFGFIFGTHLFNASSDEKINVLSKVDYVKRCRQLYAFGNRKKDLAEWNLQRTLFEKEVIAQQTKILNIHDKGIQRIFEQFNRVVINYKLYRRAQEAISDIEHGQVPRCMLCEVSILKELYEQGQRAFQATCLENLNALKLCYELMCDDFKRQIDNKISEKTFARLSAQMFKENPSLYVVHQNRVSDDVQPKSLERMRIWGYSLFTAWFVYKIFQRK